MSTDAIKLMINGVAHSVAGVAAGTTLLTVLREKLALTGAKRGCNQGVCGACTVMVDGAPVRSCLSLAANCTGQDITTAEGLAPDGALSSVQQAFVSGNAVQCGFCSPGIMISAHALLRGNRALTAEEVRAGLSGNLCRCSGYKKIVAAIVKASETRP